MTLAKDILQTEMNSGHAFDKEEKVTRTALIETLQNARESCMTVKFSKKIDDKFVLETLKSQLKNDKDLKDKKKTL